MKSIVFILIVVLPFLSYASKPRNLLEISTPNLSLSKNLRQDTLMALGLPLENRVKALKRQGERVFLSLKDIAFDSSLQLQPRWRSITALGRLFPKRSQTTLERALKSDEWFLRNAAAITIVHCERQWAVEQSLKLLDDKAMIVRTAAVQTIGKLRALETQAILWRKLYSQENYKKGKSLWVRKYIAETLSSFAHFGQEQKFIRMLSDEDRRLHRPAMKALKRITKNAIGSSQSSKLERKRWLAWWAKNKEKG